MKSWWVDLLDLSFIRPEPALPSYPRPPLGEDPRAAASFNQGDAANRRPAGQAEGLVNLSATVAADRAFPAAVAELGCSAAKETQMHGKR